MREIRYALRALWLNKGFAAVAILCLAFGIGQNTTIFSVVDGVLIQGLPYHDAEQIVMLDTVNLKAGVEEGGISYADFADWKKNSASFTSMSAMTSRSMAVSDGVGEPERYLGAEVSWDLFSTTLGIQPQLGRAFAANDDQPGAEAVVMLSDNLWVRRYQSRQSVIGEKVLINAKPHTIIGVMPPKFEFPETHKLWVPVTPRYWQTGRGERNLSVTARMKSGVTIERAGDDLGAIAKGLSAQYPGTNENWEARVSSMREQMVPDEVRLVILLMMGGATLVLLIACSNVANLQLARATVRQREIAIRSALGAGRGQIIRQLLIESVVLGLLSVPLGLAIAYVGDELLTASLPVDQVPYYIRWAIDWRSASYSVAIATGTALLFGLMPAMHAARGNLQDSLKEGTRGNTGSRGWTRNILVGAEVALSLVALVGALLFVRTFDNLNTFNLGFDPKPLMTMRYYLPGEQYEVPDAKLRRVRDIVERVEALPGVEAAFSSNLVPIDSGGGGGPVVIEGLPVEKGRERSISFVGVTPHFYRTLGVTLARGEDFNDLQGWSKTPVAVINQTMAKQFFDGQDPVGRRFRVDGATEVNDWFTIIGVANDIQHDDIDPHGTPFPAAYVPYAYQQTMNTGIVIRTTGDPAAISGAVRGVIRSADPNLPVFKVATMDAVRALSFWQFGVFGWVFSTIGILGLLLASVGVYGVLSYSVSQRTQEIGVRMALGADRKNVLKLVVGQGLRLAGYGVLAGIALGIPAMYAGQSLFYNVSFFDPASFTLVSVFLMGVAALASYAPARRAMSVSPTTALRGE
jgi:putative ABC transport system permease protein